MSSAKSKIGLLTTSGMSLAYILKAEAPGQTLEAHC